ncbi:MAG: glutamate--tRNA ligase [Phycisphaerae bacterium]
MSKSPVRVRFAPSPTGYLHVGGARTALFNYLFARRMGGRFIIRIEDTDIDRNIAGAEEKLLSDLRWLDILWDEGPDVGGPAGPYRQSERRERYDAAARHLLDAGAAYYAFDTPEELAFQRKAAEAEKRTFKYARPRQFPSDADAAAARAAGRPVVVRFAVPNEPITVHDAILGDVTFGAGEIEDLVIVKSNGWPTYHFAVVVDDEQMHISHVLRAQEHLMNTPKHVFMQRALGYGTPVFAHLPLVFNIDGTKMSKRDKHRAVRTVVKEQIKRGAWSAERVAAQVGHHAAGVARWLDKADAEFSSDQLARLASAVSAAVPEIDVHDFRAAGYLPEALPHFGALICWAPGHDREILSLGEMVASFSIDRIGKTAGRFDREKLLAMNTDYCARATPERLRSAFRDYASVSGSPIGALPDPTLDRCLSACRGLRTLHDIDTKVGRLFAADDALSADGAAVAKVLDANGGRGRATLAALGPVLESVEPWQPAAIDAAIKAFCDSAALKLADVAQPVRVALTGTTISPAIGETLALAGRDTALRRITAAAAGRGYTCPRPE